MSPLSPKIPQRLPCLLLVMLLHLPFSGNTQVSPTVQELETELQATHEASRQVYLLNELAWELRTSEPERALGFARQALSLSERLIDPSGKGDAYARMGVIYKDQGKFGEAIEAFEACLVIRKGLADSGGVAGVHNNLGNVYQRKGQLDSALAHFLVARSLRERTGDSGGLANVYNSIAITYDLMGRREDAFAEYERALAHYQQAGDQAGLARIQQNIGILYFQENKFDQAEVAYLKAIRTWKEQGNKQSEARTLNNLGLSFLETGQYEKARTYLEKSLTIQEELGNVPAIAENHYNLGLVSEIEGNRETALKWYLKSLSEAEAITAQGTLLTLYESISILYSQERQFEQALQYQQKLNELKDSLFSDESARNIAEMEAKYELEAKESRIAALEKDNQLQLAENRQQTLEQRLMLGVILGGLIITGLIFWGQRQRLKLVNLQNAQIKATYLQRILALVKENENKTLNAMLEGQEQERKRIAEDLHDRLGSMLATIKLHFSELESRMETGQNESLQEVGKVNQLLDRTFVEVREISQNLASGVLSKFGLVPALEDLKTTIEETNAMQVHIHRFGMENRLDGAFEVQLFRVIQELVTNVIKHAAAEEVRIQLTRHENELTVMVEDNGKGFNPDQLKGKEGMGLKNIAARVEKLNGKMNIDSRVNKGTTIILEFQLNTA